MRGLWTFLKSNHNRVLLGWLHGGIMVVATVLCASLLTLRCAVAVEEPPPETLAYELAKAYDQNNFDMIQSLMIVFNQKLHILFESGALEQAVRLVQIVTPAATNWTARARLSVDVEGVEPTLNQLADWQTLEAIARNQFEPTRIVLAHSIAKNEMPLQISVESGEGIIEAQIYRLFNSSKKWIGKTPLYIVLSPGLNRLIIDFTVRVGSKDVYWEDLSNLGVDLNLHDDRVSVNDLHYEGKRLARQFEFISLLREHYPASSVLQLKDNGLPSFEIPRPPNPLPTPPFRAGGGPISWGRTAYRKIQIESNPSDASILVNDKPRGTTPQVILLELQKIRIIFSKPGYLETAAEINLTEPVTTIHADLNPTP